MHNFRTFFCLLLALVFLSMCDCKGGRGGGGRGGSRGSGRSSSGSRRGSFSSSSSSSSTGGFGSSHSSGGGTWFHGFFHSTPQYTYRPIFITRSHGSGGGVSRSGDEASNYAPKEEYSSSSDDSYAIGYTISRGLSGDFFSLFNMVRGISKYPEKIKNNEIQQTTTTTTTSTTASPIDTYSQTSFNFDDAELNAIFKESLKNYEHLEPLLQPLFTVSDNINEN